MTNPVLAKSRVFSDEYVSGYPSGQQPGFTEGQYGNTTQFGTQSPYGGGTYTPSDPYAPGQYQQGVDPQGQYGNQTWAQPTPPVERPMTLDDVLTKTGITLGLMVMVAVGTVWLAKAIDPELYTTLPALSTAGLICGLGTIIFPFIAAARRKVGPGIAIAFAILEGVFIGAISLIFELVYPGIVLQAVLATFVAAALVLVAFRFGKIRLSNQVIKIVSISMMAYVGVALVNLGLHFAGIDLGLFPGPTQEVTGWAWLAAAIGVGLAVFSLIADFQYVEQGIENGAPSSESWRAAYGLTVTLVWLYVNLLRILSYIRR